ncbi:MAG: signal peptidase I [Kiritimatiellae bacterium]|nr:signal peptidase I [Kiritimatiellia bacterium]
MNWRRWVIGHRPTWTMVRAAVLALVTAWIVRHVVRPFRVAGTSMEPTVRDRAWGLGWLAAYWSGEPRRGDIVMIRLAGDSVMYLKRVLALPGETAEFRGGQLWVNGKRCAEPYLRTTCDWNSAPVTLGPGEYLVAGDRRDVRQSAHLAGVVRRERIVGKLWKWTGGGEQLQSPSSR